MICRHSKGDTNRSSYVDSHGRRPNDPDTYAPSVYTPPPRAAGSAWQSNDPSPDADRFDIEELEEVGAHLVVKARYPNCASCAYEGQKVLVFFNCTCKQAAMWRKLDPHFRDPKKHTPNLKTAPPPDARFPASVNGWRDAIGFARMKAT